ncbi:MAG: ECF-type sigma factor [Pirellulales bacterium]
MIIVATHVDRSYAEDWSSSQVPKCSQTFIFVIRSRIASIGGNPGSTPQEISQECFELINMLGDPNLEQVAMLKFEGYTNDEIADKLNKTRRTIQRMLKLIRDLWQEALNRE